MEPFKGNFSNLLNQGSSSQATNSDAQNSPSTQFPTSYPQNFRPSFLQNFHPFGPPSNYQPYRHPPIFQGAQQQDYYGQPTPGSLEGFQLQENLVHSFNQAFGFAANRSQFGMQYSTSIGAAANTSSHGSASPCHTRHNEKEVVEVEEASDSSEEGRRGTRINWTEDDNIRLMSSWLNNSVDPIKGNDKKSEQYWKAVAREFNSNMPSNGNKRNPKQCRTHWDNVKRDVTKFCGFYSKARTTFTSGYSDDMIMEKAREWYKKHNNQKPFTLEYMWKDLKDQPKWRRVLEESSHNKRNKISESGAYTSLSNQEIEEKTERKEKCLERQKAAKQRKKGKGAPSTLGDKPSQNMVLFHEAITTKAAALLKAAEATLIGAEAKKEKATAKKEKARAEKYQMYLKLMEKDTSTFSEAKLKRHENVLDQLARELAKE